MGQGVDAEDDVGVRIGVGATAIEETNVVLDSKEGGNIPSNSSDNASVQSKPPVPWAWRGLAVLLVCLIHFASSWSSGITSPMKSTLKKELHINNTEYALLSASDSFIKSVLILVTGLVTDRLGGASTLLYGNILYSIGSLLLAAAAWVRSWHFMIGAIVIQAFGDCATQVAQYQVFSSWFAPSEGFSTTLGLELLVTKLGSLAATGSANVIAKVITMIPYPSLSPSASCARCR